MDGTAASRSTHMRSGRARRGGRYSDSATAAAQLMGTAIARARAHTTAVP
ncbi:hypothetical protein SHIRM173S_06661 [Streptomyces hirsutus]